MIPVAALLAALALAAPDPLGEAQSAFAAEDYARAERLALEAGSPPGPAALYLAGLARFRAGRPAEALEALDQAGLQADAGPVWRYNRAACLYALGRFGEAEADFLEAAADPALAPVALVNAGFAALDGGDAARAAALARRAREAAPEGALDLVDDLDARIAAAGDAPAAAPTGTEHPEPSPARRWEASARAEGGWDGDALQAGLGSPAERAGPSSLRTPSAFTAAEVALVRREPLPRDASLELSYTLGQLAYLAPDARDRSLQQHLVSAALAPAPRGPLRLGGSVELQDDLAGLSGFRGLQTAAGVRGWAALDAGERSTIRLELRVARKVGSGSEFRYLTGDRVEAALSDEVRLGPLALRGGYRFLLERIGETATAVAPVPPSPLCPLGCTAVAVEPLGYAGHTGWLGARARPASWLALDVGGGLEWRGHLGDERLRLTRPDGTRLDAVRGRREDLRLFTAESATVRLGGTVSLVARHELLATSSNVAGAAGAPRLRCGPMMGGCEGAGTSASAAPKHVFVLGTAVSW